MDDVTPTDPVLLEADWNGRKILEHGDDGEHEAGIDPDRCVNVVVRRQHHKGDDLVGEEEVQGHGGQKVKGEDLLLDLRRPLGHDETHDDHLQGGYRLWFQLREYDRRLQQMMKHIVIRSRPIVLTRIIIVIIIIIVVVVVVIIIIIIIETFLT